MTRLMRTLRRLVTSGEGDAREERAAGKRERAQAPALDIALNDPIIPYLERASGPINIEKLDFDSQALRALRESGAQLVVPLRDRGQLIGLLVPELNLVSVLPSMHSQHFSSADEEARPPAQ